MTLILIALIIYSLYITIRIRDVKAANRIETQYLVEENQRLKEHEDKANFWREKYKKLLIQKNV